MSIIEELKNNLFYNNYIDTIDQKNIDFSYPHTNLNENVLKAIFKTVKSDFYLEIGSMHGGSAIVTAKYIKQNNLNTKIICIDPFCGDTNMWAFDKNHIKNNQWSFLKIKNGRPTLYDTFIANINHTKNDDIILAIPTTSSVGIDLLKKLFQEKRISTLPNLIYLDSAHSEDETYCELKKAYDLLENGGILFGDDFDWASVKNDVIKFTQTIDVNQNNLHILNFNSSNSLILEEKLLVWSGKFWFICK